MEEEKREKSLLEKAADIVIAEKDKEYDKIR
jgi:hypothetical protein